MHFTEPVYKHKETEELCRVIESITISFNDLAFDGVLTVGTSGEKVAIKRIDFIASYNLFDPGESPAASIEI